MTQWRSADYVVASWNGASRETIHVIRELRWAAQCAEAGLELPRRSKRKPRKGLYVSQNPKLPITEY